LNFFPDPKTLWFLPPQGGGIYTPGLLRNIQWDEGKVNIPRLSPSLSSFKFFKLYEQSFWSLAFQLREELFRAVYSGYTRGNESISEV
jgi:hypothetical protein